MRTGPVGAMDLPDNTMGLPELGWPFKHITDGRWSVGSKQAFFSSEVAMMEVYAPSGKPGVAFPALDPAWRRDTGGRHGLCH